MLAISPKLGSESIEVPNTELLGENIRPKNLKKSELSTQMEFSWPAPSDPSVTKIGNN